MPSVVPVSVYMVIRAPNNRFLELFSEHLIVCQLVDFWPCINRCDDIIEGC